MLPISIYNSVFIHLGRGLVRRDRERGSGRKVNMTLESSTRCSLPFANHHWTRGLQEMAAKAPEHEPRRLQSTGAVATRSSIHVSKVIFFSPNMLFFSA